MGFLSFCLFVAIEGGLSVMTLAFICCLLGGIEGGIWGEFLYQLFLIVCCDRKGHLRWVYCPFLFVVCLRSGFVILVFTCAFYEVSFCTFLICCVCSDIRGVGALRWAFIAFIVIAFVVIEARLWSEFWRRFNLLCLLRWNEGLYIESLYSFLICCVCCAKKIIRWVFVSFLFLCLLC